MNKIKIELEVVGTKEDLVDFAISLLETPDDVYRTLENNPFCDVEFGMYPEYSEVSKEDILEAVKQRFEQSYGAKTVNVSME